MESGLKSMSISSAMNTPSPLLMACRPFPQPPILPLPAHVQASPPPAGSTRKPTAAAAAPIVVAASPSKQRAAGQEEVAGWTATEYSMYSVSPPPSSVPMPTSLLLTAASGRKKAPTACAVQVAAGVDVGATDELRRLLRL
uniref:Uncharacterized protein n=1 Tax=Avena sativa TaxID=4498 RepID=A0ACD5XZA5_AVESA